MALQSRDSIPADLVDGADLANSTALPDGAPEVGEYRLDLATDRWWWSAETYAIHGFEPGEVVPTTAMFLAHKHPDDRERVHALLTAAATKGTAFRSIHRIIDAHGRERTIILTGSTEQSTAGRIATLSGTFIDVTSAVRTAAAAEASRAIAASARARAVIEQAKGALAVVFDIDAETAFELLRTGSSAANVPVRTLADWVLSFARRLLRDAPAGPTDMARFLRSPAAPA